MSRSYPLANLLSNRSICPDVNSAGGSGMRLSLDSLQVFKSLGYVLSILQHHFIALNHALRKGQKRELSWISAINMWQILATSTVFLVAQRSSCQRLCSVCCMWKKAHYCYIFTHSQMNSI